MALSLTVLFAAILYLFSTTANAQTNQAETKTSFLSTDTFQLADGFKAELVYQVAPDYGSWVSLTTSPSGLIASDQYGKLYRIVPGKSAKETKVQPIPLDIGHAQGLLWAFDSLYVMSHGKEKRPGGLYRLTDSDGDGELDEFKLLRKIEGGGEHGPHAIVLSPDGESLYVCAGNHTKLTDVQSSQVPRNWREDNLIERMWDPGGHAVGMMAPGGWICKTDPEGKAWELISIGYRNQYDIAFDTNGELFTYDADMEWDIGTPWYRPTRVCHATPGSEFGWRGGDAKWPTYYPDSVPPVIDIGPGSPTGIVFGTGASFPEKYQKALFIADWSFGFIYAIHMQPDGGTYKAEKELFCSAAALQVTDMIVHDGALYFTIGGRRTQSAMYRIESTGSEVAVINEPVQLTDLQNLRQSIEASEPNLELAWQHLGHDDRAVRYACRTHLERLPLVDWLDRWADDLPIQERLEAMLAACRHSDSGTEIATRLLSQILTTESEWDELSEQQQLHLLRVSALMLIRLCPESEIEDVRAALRGKFSAHYPSDNSIALNHELCRLLVFCDEPSAVSKTMGLVDAAVTQEEQIVYVMCLRKAKQGWDQELRNRYLSWFVKSAVFQGGKSFAGYLKNARDEFIGTLSDAEKTELAGLIDVEMTEQDPYAELKSREVVKEWTVAELLPTVQKAAEANFAGRDLQNGKRVFATAQCYKCHQFAGSGGIVGPDLTGLSRRYTNQYLLETLIDPNKEISSQYQATLFELEDGRMISGRVANLVNDDYLVQEDMIAPGKLTAVNRNNIMESKPSKISPMPEHLLDTFTQEEILDLLAYLRSER